MIIPLDQVSDRMDELVKRVLRGEIFIYPTDTIAGIGCIGTSKKSVDRLFEIKHRDLDKPISYAFADTEHIFEFANIQDKYHRILELLPGPLTLVLNRNKSASAELYGIDADTIGVRVPKGDWFLELIRKVGYPIVTTSANLSGESPSGSFSSLSEKLKEEVEFIISWEGTLSEQASTIISLIHDLKIIRDGKITRNEIMSLSEN